MRSITITIIRPPDRRDTFTHRLIKDTKDMIISEFRFDIPGPVSVGERDAIMPGDRGLLFEYRSGYEVIAVAHQDMLSGYYVNINLPFERVTGGYLIKDLFLDLWVWPDGSFQVLDEDEFKEACCKGWLSEKERLFASNVMERLLARLKKKMFPPRYVAEFSRRWLNSFRGIPISGE